MQLKLLSLNYKKFRSIKVLINERVPTKYSLIKLIKSLTYFKHIIFWQFIKIMIFECSLSGILYVSFYVFMYMYVYTVGVINYI